MTSLSVYLERRLAGVAKPFVLRHHLRPAVPHAVRAQPQPTGIDYLGLVLGRPDASTIEQIAYRELTEPGLEPPARALTHPEGVGDLNRIPNDRCWERHG